MINASVTGINAKDLCETMSSIEVWGLDPLRLDRSRRKGMVSWFLETSIAYNLRKDKGGILAI